MQPCLLIYDIPDESECVNPSNALRPIAIRINLSCWVVQESDIPYPLLNYLSDNGATWHVVRFDVGENKKLIEMAVAAIKTDIRESIKRTQDACERAGNRMTNSTADPVQRVKKFRGKVLAATKKVRKTVTALCEAARRFGIDSSLIGRNGCLQAINGLQRSMQERAKAYVDAVYEVQSHCGHDNAMVKASKQGLVPPPILADYLDDIGGNGQKVRTLFA